MHGPAGIGKSALLHHALVEGLRASALTAPPREARDALREARGLCADHRLALDEIEVILDLGERELADGGREAARAAFGAAGDLAERRGTEALAERIRAAALRAGSRPRRFARTGIAALTPSEHRIIELVARGHTNRDIAEELFLSEKTVENHLTRAYGKLGVRSRAQVGALLEA